MQTTIAVVEDERDQRENYVAALSDRYRVCTYASRLEALEGLEREAPDLAILDVILGDEVDGGFELCREMLSRRPGLPIVFVSTRVDEISQISGLNLGAWDYIAKPVALPVLVQKVRRLLWVAAHPARSADAAELLEVGDLRVDVGRMRVSWQGSPIDLTLTEFREVTGLARRPGRVMSYEQLMDAAEQGVVTRNTVTTHIRNLRKKFKAVDPGFRQIATQYRVGYRWVE
ncbi:MAG: response regulator transcription factor [Myxococcota bacterium]|nr:response regulator transcription factor [Myxococcota bacterium]